MLDEQFEEKDLEARSLEQLKDTLRRSGYLLFELVDPAENKNRFYYLAWQPTLFAPQAVVRIYGRKGGLQRALSPVPFESLGEAWPLIHDTVRRRLRHGYRIISPRDCQEIS